MVVHSPALGLVAQCSGAQRFTSRRDDGQSASHALGISSGLLEYGPDKPAALASPRLARAGLLATLRGHRPVERGGRPCASAWPAEGEVPSHGDGGGAPAPARRRAPLGPPASGGFSSAESCGRRGSSLRRSTPASLRPGVSGLTTGGLATIPELSAVGDVALPSGIGERALERPERPWTSRKASAMRNRGVAYPAGPRHGPLVVQNGAYWVAASELPRYTLASFAAQSMHGTLLRCHPEPLAPRWTRRHFSLKSGVLQCCQGSGGRHIRLRCLDGARVIVEPQSYSGFHFCVVFGDGACWRFCCLDRSEAKSWVLSIAGACSYYRYGAGQEQLPTLTPAEGGLRDVRARSAEGRDAPHSGRGFVAQGAVLTTAAIAQTVVPNSLKVRGVLRLKQFARAFLHICKALYCTTTTKAPWSFLFVGRYAAHVSAVAKMSGASLLAWQRFLAICSSGQFSFFVIIFARAMRPFFCSASGRCKCIPTA